MFHVKQNRGKDFIRLDPGSGDGKYGARESEPSAELTVRVRIRGRDQRPDQGQRSSGTGHEGLVDEEAAAGAEAEAEAEETQASSVSATVVGALEEQVASEDGAEDADGTPSQESVPGVPLKDPFGLVTDEGVVEAGDYVPRPIPRILAVANQKGGVGKTTTAVNLGAALAELGFRVLVVDLDPQGNATTGLGIDARSFELSMYDVLMRDVSLEDAVEPTSMKNLFVAPATIDLAGAEIELVPSFSRELKLRRALEAVSGDFDFILIDCPPSLGLITVNGLAAADEVLVPIQCEYYALEGLGQLLRNVHLVQANLNERLEVSTIVLTMYDARTKLAEQVADEVRTHFGNKVCKNVIPRTVRISEAPSFGQPITVFDPTSRGAIAYRELAKEVSGGAA
jgi:chromosome partitioning protein